MLFYLDRSRLQLHHRLELEVKLDRACCLIRRREVRSDRSKVDIHAGPAEGLSIARRAGRLCGIGLVDLIQINKRQRNHASVACVGGEAARLAIDQKAQ